MIEKDVAFFGSLLGIETEVVEKAIEDGSLGTKVEALGLLNKDQVENLKTNHAKEVKTKYLTELTDSAKKGELPSELYTVVKGASYEKLERDLSKEYGVSEYDDVKDLVAKAIKNKTTQTDDKKLQELTEKNEALQEVNQNLVLEKDKAVTEAQKKYEGMILNKESADETLKVPFDFSDVEESELENIQKSRRGTVDTVFNARYDLAFDDGKPVVMKDGDILKDPVTLEPVPIVNVKTGIASELGIKLVSPETGGQGGKSSGTKPGKYSTIEEFNAAMAKQKIMPTSAEGIKAFKDSGLAVI